MPNTKPVGFVFMNEGMSTGKKRTVNIDIERSVEMVTLNLIVSDMRFLECNCQMRLWQVNGEMVTPNTPLSMWLNNYDEIGVELTPLSKEMSWYDAFNEDAAS
ncbi:hypothetical protein GGF41_003238, partial [Coemansia sp. RSA 2531]